MTDLAHLALTEDTDARWQARVLHAVADHLLAHDTLPPVHISPWRRPGGRARLSMDAARTEQVAALTQWADSLQVDHVIVHRRPRYDLPPGSISRVELHAHGRILGSYGRGYGCVVDLDAFCDVPALDRSALAHGETVLLADLRAACAQDTPLAEALAAVQGGDRP